ncbi:hypothetical protein [Cellulophaga omnivescoria]|uniref:hypothetical protein n=1 Tax=Cellulophaga omnivescoria TaxID=1888890 RepID=UPI0009847359|nr:hypothetical protein [Cellulophaga omnivescoria]
MKVNNMEMTSKIGKILSVYLVITGIGFSVSSEFFSQMISHKGTDPVLINLSGMVHFFIGVAILVNHFLWKNMLQILVSVLGCMFLLKGIFLIALPELTLQSADNKVQIPWLMSTGFILVGLTVGCLVFLSKNRLKEKK